MKFLTFCMVLSLFYLKIYGESYKDAKVVDFTIDTEKQLEALKRLELDDGFKFWISPYLVGIKTQLIILPQKFIEFQELAQETGLIYQLITDNVQSWFDKEKPERSRRRKDSEIVFDEYKTYEEILNFLDQMHADYPNVTEIFTLGTSFEGRVIKGIKITKNEDNPILFIDAHIHAREWIASASAVWLIHELLTTQDVNVRELVDGLTWIIIPLLNPDGYIYSQNVDRTWRKTRSTHASMLCTGADPNRNFAYNFMMGGASQVACTDTFAGRAPYTEPEVKALVDYYEKVHEKVKIYLSFHSAAEMILYPMGHTGTFEEVPNVADLDAIAAAAATAIKVRYGTNYVYGNSYNTLSVASGTSKDHMYGHFKTPISYTYEFRVAKNGLRFVLPADEIIPNSEEMFDGILAMIVKSKELGYF
ncbi:hypothetical protein ACKWTF_016436 [Chironomus riparius]